MKETRKFSSELIALSPDQQNVIFGSMAVPMVALARRYSSYLNADRSPTRNYSSLRGMGQIAAGTIMDLISMKAKGKDLEFSIDAELNLSDERLAFGIYLLLASVMRNHPVVKPVEELALSIH